MTLFILTETSAGYALLKAKDKKLLKRDDLETQTATAEGVSSLYVDFFFLFIPCSSSEVMGRRMWCEKQRRKKK